MLKARNVLATACIGVMSAVGSVSAQIPGAPVLQNAFANPGLAVAANIGGGTDQSLFALAAGWGLGSGRILLSGAAGAQRSNEATRGAYGARASVTAWSTAGGSFGVGAFAGIGGAPRTRDNNVMTNAAVVSVPVGATASYRRYVGRTRGLSVYASPMYRWARLTTDDDGTDSEGSFRISGGLDFSFTPSFGVTVGAEFGSGSESSLVGAAISWVPGGRR